MPTHRIAAIATTLATLTLGCALEAPSTDEEAPVATDVAALAFSGAVDANGASWQTLGDFVITGDTLVVMLTNLADEFVIADAVRIERVS